MKITAAVSRVTALGKGLASAVARGVRARSPLTTRRGMLISLLVLAITAGAAAGILRLKVETTVDSFLPQDEPEVAALAEHARTFGGNPIVVLLESSKPRTLLLDGKQFDKLMRVEGHLSGLPDVAAVYGPATVMNQIVISSQGMIARLSGTRDKIRAVAEEKARRDGESESEIQAVGDAATTDFDKRYGSLLVRGLPAGLPTTDNPNFIKNVIYDERGEPRARWHFVVPDTNSVAVLVRTRQGIDQAATTRLVESVKRTVERSGLQTSKVTTSGVPVITSELANEAKEEMPLLGGLAGLLLLLRFLVAPAHSSWLRRLWPLFAALLGSALTLAVFGWAGVSMSFGAIVLLPLLLGIGSSFPLYLATTVSRRRVVVVAGASAVAFGSLAVSPLPFVRELGFALGLGVLFTVAVAVALERFCSLTLAASTHAKRDIGRGSMPRVRRWALMGCLVAVACGGWAMLPSMDVEADPDELAKGLPALEQARYVEDKLGSSGEISVVLRGTDAQGPDALRWMTRAEDTLVSKYGDQLRPILTAPDLLGFLGESPSPAQISAGLQLMPSYLTSAVFSPDGREAVMTFGLRFEDVGEQTDMLADVEAALPEPPGDANAEVVGLPVAASKAYELVSADRYLANVVGIVAAGAVLLAGLRNRRDALLGMLAATLATGWTIAGLWLLGQSLNPLTIALGSLATVTACEFTVLLIDGRGRGQSGLRKMVAWACATSAIGYLALVVSQIGVLREFGTTLAVAVLLSYVAAVAVVRLCARDTSGKPSPVPRAPARVSIVPSEVSS